MNIGIIHFSLYYCLQATDLYPATMCRFLTCTCHTTRTSVAEGYSDGAQNII